MEQQKHNRQKSVTHGSFSKLEVCRKSWVTFGKVQPSTTLLILRNNSKSQNIFAKDETGAYNLLPIKEQCGVRDPYVNQYGKEAGTMRNYTIHDTCACVKNPRKIKYHKYVCIIKELMFRRH